MPTGLGGVERVKIRLRIARYFWNRNVVRAVSWATAAVFLVVVCVGVFAASSDEETYWRWVGCIGLALGGLPVLFIFFQAGELVVLQRRQPQSLTKGQTIRLADRMAVAATGAFLAGVGLAATLRPADLGEAMLWTALPVIGLISASAALGALRGSGAR